MGLQDKISKTLIHLTQGSNIQITMEPIPRSQTLILSVLRSQIYVKINSYEKKKLSRSTNNLVQIYTLGALLCSNRVFDAYLCKSFLQTRSSRPRSLPLYDPIEEIFSKRIVGSLLENLFLKALKPENKKREEWGGDCTGRPRGVWDVQPSMVF